MTWNTRRRPTMNYEWQGRLACAEECTSGRVGDRYGERGASCPEELHPDEGIQERGMRTAESNERTSSERENWD